MSPALPHRRLQWLLLLAAIGYWALMIYATHTVITPTAAGLVRQMHVSDKLLHFAGFAGLGLLLALAVATRCRMSRTTLVGLAVAMSAYAAIDEVTQARVGRTSDLADWLADTLGGCAGLLLFVIVRSSVASRGVATIAESKPEAAALPGALPGPYFLRLSDAVSNWESAPDSDAGRSNETTRSFSAGRRAA